MPALSRVQTSIFVFNVYVFVWQQQQQRSRFLSFFTFTARSTLSIRPLCSERAHTNTSLFVVVVNFRRNHMLTTASHNHFSLRIMRALACVGTVSRRATTHPSPNAATNKGTHISCSLDIYYCVHIKISNSGVASLAIAATQQQCYGGCCWRIRAIHGVAFDGIYVMHAIPFADVIVIVFQSNLLVLAHVMREQR